ncbi:MAG: hypothetical protein WBA93_28470 [Microcoleaceae cyanobacterium]
MNVEIATLGILQPSQKDPSKEWREAGKQIISDYIKKEICLAWEATEKTLEGETRNIPYTASLTTIQTLMLEQRGLLDEHRNN